MIYVVTWWSWLGGFIFDYLMGLQGLFFSLFLPRLTTPARGLFDITCSACPNLQAHKPPRISRSSAVALAISRPASTISSSIHQSPTNNSSNGDMTVVKDLRSQYQDAFSKRYGIKLPSSTVTASTCPLRFTPTMPADSVSGDVMKIVSLEIRFMNMHVAVSRSYRWMKPYFVMR